MHPTELITKLIIITLAFNGGQVDPDDYSNQNVGAWLGDVKVDLELPWDVRNMRVGD